MARYSFFMSYTLVGIRLSKSAVSDSQPASLSTVLNRLTLICKYELGSKAALICNIRRMKKKKGGSYMGVIVSDVALPMRVHELRGGASDDTPKEGVYLFGC